MDRELFLAILKNDNLHKIAIKSANRDSVEGCAFREARNYYKSLYRKKMLNYFSDIFIYLFIKCIKNRKGANARLRRVSVKTMIKIKIHRSLNPQNSSGLFIREL